MLSRPLHEVWSRFVLSDFHTQYSYNPRHDRGSAFLVKLYGKVQGTQTRRKTFKTHLLYKYPLKHNHQKKKVRGKKTCYLHSSHSCFFLDLNFKHTSITQQHISPTYIVPLDRYSLLLLKALAPAVLKKRIHRVVDWAESSVRPKSAYSTNFFSIICRESLLKLHFLF